MGGPIATERTYFYKNKDTKLHLESVADADDSFSILVTRGFPEQKLLLSKGFNNLFITLKTLNSLQMLAQNKVDLIVSGDYTVKHLINKKQIDGLVTAYVCNDFVCKLPVTDVGMLDKLLN